MLKILSNRLSKKSSEVTFATNYFNCARYEHICTCVQRDNEYLDYIDLYEYCHDTYRFDY